MRPRPRPEGPDLRSEEVRCDPSFRIDTDLGAFGLQNTLYISPGASEGRVYVYADKDDDSTAGSMEVFNIVNPEPGASPATGTIRVHEVEPAFELRAVDDQTFQLGVARSVTLPVAVGGTSPYTYALTCRPTLADAGLTFTASTRVLSGTSASLTVEYLGVDCVYSATDSDSTKVDAGVHGDHRQSVGTHPALRGESDLQSRRAGERPSFSRQLAAPPLIRTLSNVPRACRFRVPPRADPTVSTSPPRPGCSPAFQPSPTTPPATTPPPTALHPFGGRCRDPSSCPSPDRRPACCRINTTGVSNDPIEFPVEQVTRHTLPPVEGGDGSPISSRSKAVPTGCGSRRQPARLSSELRPGHPGYVHFQGERQRHPDAGDRLLRLLRPCAATACRLLLLRDPARRGAQSSGRPAHHLDRASPRPDGTAKPPSTDVVLTYTLQPALPAGLCLYETTSSTPPTSSTTCATSPETNDSYQRVADTEDSYLWIIGTPKFSSLLRRYCWTVSDAAGTAPPPERCFYLATVSFDVPRFTNLTETRYSVTALSIILSKTDPCDGCPTTAIGTAARVAPTHMTSSSPCPFDRATGRTPMAPSLWSPASGKTNSLFSFVAPSRSSRSSHCSLDLTG